MGASQDAVMIAVRRSAIAGESSSTATHRRHCGAYVLTQVTYGRQRWLCDDLARSALRGAIAKVGRKYPFKIEAFVLLPDHFHCVWRLPENDGDFSVRMRLIKSDVTRSIGDRLRLELAGTASRERRRERNLWQRRFWEHRIRDEAEFAVFCDYVHFNPVKHGLCGSPTDWPRSSVYRFIRDGVYPPGWGQIR